MKHPEGVTLRATTCNTVGVASAFALWLSDGAQHYVVDLSDHMQGSGGLTGIAFHGGRIYGAVQ